MNCTCDIIIPTYNNADTLSLVIESIQGQHIPEGWTVRILICDDGSQNNKAGGDSVVSAGPAEPLPHPTASDYLQGLGGAAPGSSPAVEVLIGPHGGAAAARNRGIAASQATVVLFLGADIILRPGALAAHLTFHQEHPEDTAAVLGMVQWDPRLRPTPLMAWLMHGGPQNDFDETLGSRTVDTERFFYGSHLSLKRSMLMKERFDESYAGYGHEDQDLGRRLKKLGVQLHILHQAVGLHRHRYTPDTFFKRQQMTGVPKVLFRRKWKEAHGISLKHRLQYWVYLLGIGLLLREFVRVVGERHSVPKLFAHVSNYEYRRGLIKALQAI